MSVGNHWEIQGGKFSRVSADDHDVTTPSRRQSVRNMGCHRLPADVDQRFRPPHTTALPTGQDSSGDVHQSVGGNTGRVELQQEGVDALSFVVLADLGMT